MFYPTRIWILNLGCSWSPTPAQHCLWLIYRHPGTKLDKTVAEKLNSEGKYCLLMGDFNNKALKCDSETEDFVNTLGSYSFHPQLLKPTRITNHSSTLIDNIFFNYLENHVVSCGNIGSVVSLIIWLFFFIINKLSTLLTNYKLFKRDYSKVDSEALIAEVENVNWLEALR